MIGKLTGLARGMLKRNIGLRIRVKRVLTRVRFQRYRWHARAAIDVKLIVFESFGGRSYAGSPRALYEAILEDVRFATHRFAWVMRDPEHATEFPTLQDARTTIVTFGKTEYYRAFARARVWISNSILLSQLVPRGQLYVQTWHGVGIKRIGLDVARMATTALDTKAEIDERYLIEAPKIDLFLSPAPFGTKVFASAFGLPESGVGSPFVETGNPSNDVLSTATATQVAAARARLGLADGVRAVLYAPTFRDDEHDPRAGYFSKQPLEMDALAKVLGPQYAVLLRTHYLVSASGALRRQEGLVRDVSAIDDTNELLLASDVLITDYSSLCADFTVLDRPMIFYVYDLDRYDRDLRGFYFPVEDLPGPLVRTQDELVTALLDPGLPARYAEQRRAFRARMGPHDDGRARARVLDLIAGRLSAQQVPNSDS